MAIEDDLAFEKLMSTGFSKDEQAALERAMTGVELVPIVPGRQEIVRMHNALQAALYGMDRVTSGRRMDEFLDRAGQMIGNPTGQKLRIANVGSVLTRVTSTSPRYKMGKV